MLVARGRTKRPERSGEPELRPSDHLALAFLVDRAPTTSAGLGRALDWGRQWAGARLRSLETRGLAEASLGTGGEFIWRPTRRGVALLSALGPPSLDRAGGPAARRGETGWAPRTHA
jgi:hypothetical protein